MSNFLASNSSEADSRTSRDKDIDHFHSPEEQQVEQVKQFLAQAIGTRKFTKYTKWHYEEDEIEQEIVKR